MATNEPPMTDEERKYLEEYQAQEKAREVREKQIEKIRAVLARMKASVDCTHADTALVILFEKYLAAIPPIEEGFSEALRTSEISGEPVVDKAIWLLMRGSELFGKCVLEVDEHYVKAAAGEAAKQS